MPQVRAELEPTQKAVFEATPLIFMTLMRWGSNVAAISNPQGTLPISARAGGSAAMCELRLCRGVRPRGVGKLRLVCDRTDSRMKNVKGSMPRGASGGSRFGQAELEMRDFGLRCFAHHYNSCERETLRNVRTNISGPEQAQPSHRIASGSLHGYQAWLPRLRAAMWKTPKRARSSVPRK